MTDHNYLAVKIAVLWCSLLVVTSTVMLMLTAVVVVPAEQGVVLQAGWILLAVSVLVGYLYLAHLASLLAATTGRIDLDGQYASSLVAGQFCTFAGGMVLVVLSTTGAVA